jgi:hypothetical protein
MYVGFFTVKAEFLFSLGREARCTLAATDASVAVSASCHQHALALPRGIFFVIFSAQKAADAHTYCYIKIIDAKHHAENHRVRAQFQRRQRQKGEEKKWLNFVSICLSIIFRDWCNGKNLTTQSANKSIPIDLGNRK